MVVGVVVQTGADTIEGLVFYTGSVQRLGEKSETCWEPMLEPMHHRQPRRHPEVAPTTHYDTHYFLLLCHSATLPRTLPHCIGLLSQHVLALARQLVGPCSSCISDAMAVPHYLCTMTYSQPCHRPSAPSGYYSFCPLCQSYRASPPPKHTSPSSPAQVPIPTISSLMPSLARPLDYVHAKVHDPASNLGLGLASCNCLAWLATSRWTLRGGHHRELGNEPSGCAKLHS
jgi:hypothetical protein